MNIKPFMTLASERLAGTHPSILEEKKRRVLLKRSLKPNLERSLKLKTGISVEEISLVNLFECSYSLL